MSERFKLTVVGQGQPIVLLQGFGFHQGIWDCLLPSLQEQYQAITVEYPGFGHHQIAIEPLSIDQYLNSLVEQINSITDEPVIWMGHSLGGWYARWLALHHLERTAGFFTICSTSRFMDDENWRGFSVKTIEELKLAIIDNKLLALKNFLCLVTAKPSSVTYLIKQFTSMPVPKKAALVQQLDWLLKADLREMAIPDRLNRRHILTLKDQLVFDNPIDSDDRILRLEGADHFPLVQHEQLIIDELSKITLSKITQGYSQ